jgi:hypothetical protein
MNYQQKKIKILNNNKAVRIIIYERDNKIILII